MDLVRMGFHTNQGKNDYNEDRYVALRPVPGDDGSFFFGVYDGHGGIEASTYCQKHLHDNVVSHEKYALNKKEALIEGFKLTDRKFLKKLEDCGSTACVAILTADAKKLIVANAGDTRCVVSYGGKAVAISEDHKPANPGEKKRIKEADHTVDIETVLIDGKRHQISRIDAQIAVSRAIGDGDFKDEGMAQEKTAITCVPDVYERELKSSDEFFIIACDGLWDVMENKEVVEFVSKLLSKNKNNITDELLNSISEQLTTHAVEKKNSPDNVTVVIVTIPKKQKKSKSDEKKEKTKK
eukprot:TRINITY_DN2732_c0_g2_i1.p1 TRINITY_DN2732_c0_g2~~TRINITY_DN2732_c0_g2_i1.p1  ORF type:complete len:342 (-),score=130.97 TRINITY_DN2732_c0_g2_i1:227-1114(-)